MPKKKTKKAAVKRFKKTAGGKVTFTRAGRGHLMSSKSRKRKRSLRAGGVLSPVEAKRITKLI
jgi:large subunit ribosomal protein L35